MRFIVLAVFIFFAPPVAGQTISGREFLIICQKDIGLCAAMIRDELKDWPETVVYPTTYIDGKKYDKLWCPPYYNDKDLADLFNSRAYYQQIDGTGRSARQTIRDIMNASFPTCASTRLN